MSCPPRRRSLREFPLMVQLVSVAVPAVTVDATACRRRRAAEFPLMVQLVSVAVPALSHPAAVGVRSFR